MNIKAITDIIQEPVHGIKFYTKDTLKELVNTVYEISKSLELTSQSTPETIISIINNYIKCNVKLRSQYFDAFCERTDCFDKNELVYRTAYGALVKGEAMCAGFAEAVRILLSAYGIKSYTLLTKLPGDNRRLLHYVVVAEYKKEGNNKYAVLDPERQAFCEMRGLNFERYQSNIIYAFPDSIFTNDVVGETGLGMLAKEYFEHQEIPRVQGKENIGKIIMIQKAKQGLEDKDGNFDRD